ncbi:MurR/RpiR family transcriptional regulator [Streptococcus dentiloxodontae]
MLIQEKLDITPFSNSEQIIVDFIKKEKFNIEKLSTTQIAKETFSSKSTLVKLAKRLNFKGWTDFKQAYLEELHYLEKSKNQIDANLPFKKNDHPLTIANNIAKVKQEAIEDTLSLLTNDTIQKAADLLNTAETIHVIAVTNNLLLANEFKYNMNRIKKHVSVHSLHGEGSLAATMSTPRDCVLVISYSGETGSLRPMVTNFYRNHVPIILISNFGESSFSKLADVHIKMSTREKLYSKIATFANDASITYLLDLLYGLIFAKHYEDNLDYRTNHSERFEASRQTKGSHLKQ